MMQHIVYTSSHVFPCANSSLLFFSQIPLSPITELWWWVYGSISSRTAHLFQLAQMFTFMHVVEKSVAEFTLNVIMLAGQYWRSPTPLHFPLLTNLKTYFNKTQQKQNKTCQSHNHRVSYENIGSICCYSWHLYFSWQCPNSLTLSEQQLNRSSEANH